MKNGVVAILVFVAAFVITTAVLIFLNTQFKNIFKYDFTPVNHAVPASDSTNINKADSLSVAKDSTTAMDSLKNIAANLAQNKDSLASSTNAQNVNSDSKTANSQKPENNQNSQAQTQTSSQNPPESNKSNADLKNIDIKKMDPAAYEKWKKNTAKIMEAMDSYKASQILRMYADNIGNELLYVMKKKKAAEILSKYDAKKDSLLIRKLTRIQ